MNKSFYIWDLDGTLVHLKGDWAAVHQMISPKKNVVDACADMVSKGGLDCAQFMEDLSRLELKDPPEALYAAKTCLQLDGQQFICTNNTEMTARTVCQRLGLPISGIVGIDQVSYGKPSPEGIKKIIKDYNLNPKYGLFIGNADSDEAAAKAAGISFMNVSSLNGKFKK